MWTFQLSPHHRKRGVVDSRCKRRWSTWPWKRDWKESAFLPWVQKDWKSRFEDACYWCDYGCAKCSHPCYGLRSINKRMGIQVVWYWRQRVWLARWRNYPLNLRYEGSCHWSSVHLSFSWRLSRVSDWRWQMLRLGKFRQRSTGTETSKG